MRKILENNQSRGLKWPTFSPPRPLPPPLSVSSPLSAPLFKKRCVLLSNSKRKNQLEILTCLIALTTLIKRFIQSYHIPLISFAVYKCTCTCFLRQKETGRQSHVLMSYCVKCFSISFYYGGRPFSFVNFEAHLLVCIENVLYK